MRAESPKIGSCGIESKAEAIVLDGEGVVFLRSEFSKLGSRSQVGRALRELASRGVVVKVGHGIYAKARKSSLSGNPVPTADLISIGFEALRKLGIDADFSSAMKVLFKGRTTQVPMALAISVDRHVGRKIGFGHQRIAFERR